MSFWGDVLSWPGFVPKVRCMCNIFVESLNSAGIMQNLATCHPIVPVMEPLHCHIGIYGT